MRSPREHQCRNVQAFTLVELLTVIVVIAILTSLLLPALTKAKGRVQTLACINNLKELEGSCHLYTSDFNDYLPPNNPITLTTLANGARAVSAMNYDSWCPGMAPTDINTVNLSQGLIFPYNRSPFIYRCPADTSTINGSSTTLRTRSYSMDVSLNSDQANSTYIKYTDIKQQPATDLFDLIDAHPLDIQDAPFDISGKDSLWSTDWLNLPADRHNQGANLTFVDGHAEYWKWHAPKVYYGDYTPAYSVADLADLQRLQAAAKPDVN